MNKTAYFLLALTSVAPIALVYGAAQYPVQPWLTYSFFGFAVVLCWLCYEILGYAKRTIEIEPLSITNMRSANHEVVGFLLTYLLPLLIPDDGSGRGRLFAVIIFLALMTVMILRGNLLHVNPLMGLIGYQFFEVTSSSGYSYLLITKSKNRELTKRRGVALSSTLYLEV